MTTPRIPPNPTRMPARSQVSAHDKEVFGHDTEPGELPQPAPFLERRQPYFVPPSDRRQSAILAFIALLMLVFLGLVLFVWLKT